MTETTGGKQPLRAQTVDDVVTEHQVVDPVHLHWLKAAGKPSGHAVSDDGKPSGHGFFSWRPADVGASRPGRGKLADGTKRPVVVLLDGHVKEHDFLEAQFLRRATDWGGAPEEQTLARLAAAAGITLTSDDPAQVRAQLAGLTGPVRYDSHYGHATFVAGVVRQVAPDAVVLSVPVADDLGNGNENTITAALRWLATDGRDALEPDEQLAAVLMPSGRQLTPETLAAEEARGDHSVRDLTAAIAALDVPFVVSAGNYGDDVPVFPAYLAADHPHVVAVGALDRRRRAARYTSTGPWVTAWEVGTDVLSCTPLQYDVHRFVLWSGTSFSAAVHAGRIAQAAVRLAVPAPTADAEPVSLTAQV